MKIKKGVPLIGKINDKDIEIYKNVEYLVKGYDDDFVYINDMKIEIKNVIKSLELGYAMTIHKSQGSTINNKYIIYQWNLLDKKLKYVALSRGKTINKIIIKH